MPTLNLTVLEANFVRDCMNECHMDPSFERTPDWTVYNKLRNMGIEGNMFVCVNKEGFTMEAVNE
jgi:hypothetical protein